MICHSAASSQRTSPEEVLAREFSGMRSGWWLVAGGRILHANENHIGSIYKSWR